MKMVNSMRAAVAAVLLAGAGAVVFLSTGAEPVEARQAAPPPVRLAIINSRVILNEAPGRAQAASALEREMTTIRAEIQRMSDSLDAMVRDYETIEATLSPPVREQRRRAIQDKQGQFELRRDSLGQRADRRQVELMQPILDLVNRVIQDVRDESGYSVIMDIGGEAHGIVAYDKNLDSTDRVLARVRRQEAPAAAPRRDTTTADAAGTGSGPPPR
jgi:Skp family chaperone for outer membrane proteins